MSDQKTGGPQIGPDEVVIVGAQLLASDRASCGGFDRPTKANWDWPSATAPLLDSLRFDANKPGESGLPAHFFTCAFDQIGLCHAAMIRRSLTHRNRYCLTADRVGRMPRC